MRRRFSIPGVVVLGLSACEPALALPELVCPPIAVGDPDRLAACLQGLRQELPLLQSCACPLGY
jgi:hypothetical protein